MKVKSGSESALAADRDDLPFFPNVPCLSTLSTSMLQGENPSIATAGDKMMDWQLQQLRKSDTDRVLGGICGGLGEYTPVPALAWRLIFVLATLSGGAGVIVYLLMWWLMPAAGSTGATAGSAWNLHALRRSVTDCEVAGVCGGLGEYTPVPSWLWRVALLGLIFAGGAGLLAYALLWLLVPKAEPATSEA